MANGTEVTCFVVAGVSGVAAAVFGTYMIVMMDELSKASLISLSVFLSILLIVMITLVVVGAYLTTLSGHGADCAGAKGECGLLQAAFIMSGFSMMLNIRLCYSTAPYALMRFKLPENIFSVFVRRVASSMELWCLPTLLVADALEHGAKILVELESETAFGKLKKDESDTKAAEQEPNRNLKLATIIGPSILSQWLNFLTYVLLLFVYVPGEQDHLTAYYWVIAASGLVFGINNPLTFAVDEGYLPIYIAGENCFPATTSFIHYLSSLVFGNRRRWNSDFIMVYIDLVVAIILSLLSAVVWTIGFLAKHDASGGKRFVHLKGTEPYGTGAKWFVILPIFQVLVGLGMVYAIYPGIAPGMIVPFYLIDKIEMTLLIMTIVPAFCVALARADKLVPGNGGWMGKGSPTCDWSDGAGVGWHFFDIIIPLMIILAAIFIYSIHYRESSISRAIINQPKMSTFLTILYYMCSEIGLAIGFPGTFGNNGNGILALATQLVAIFLMTFLAMYSEGYLIEYKKYDSATWPTTGMTRWNAFKYWCKRASKNTNQNFKDLFTKDVRRDLLICIERDNLI